MRAGAFAISHLGDRAVRDEPPFAHPAVRHAILELNAGQSRAPTSNASKHNNPELCGACQDLSCTRNQAYPTQRAGIELPPHRLNGIRVCCQTPPKARLTVLTMGWRTRRNFRKAREYILALVVAARCGRSTRCWAVLMCRSRVQCECRTTVPDPRRGATARGTGLLLRRLWRSRNARTRSRWLLLLTRNRSRRQSAARYV